MGARATSLPTCEGETEGSLSLSSPSPLSFTQISCAFVKSDCSMGIGKTAVAAMTIVGRDL